MEFMEMERQLQDNVTKRLQAILEPEDLLFDEPMKDYTTFRVGGPAKWMAAPQDEQQLRVILKICSEMQLPCFILGRVSNLLVSDNGFDGLIVNLRKHFNKTSMYIIHIYVILYISLTFFLVIFSKKHLYAIFNISAYLTFSIFMFYR